jgi:hypothetical protein
MKIQHILIASLSCGFLTGCVHHQSTSAASNATKPAEKTHAQALVLVGGPASFTVQPSTNAGPLLSYDWVFNGTNTAGVTNQ